MVVYSLRNILNIVCFLFFESNLGFQSVRCKRCPGFPFLCFRKSLIRPDILASTQKPSPSEEDKNLEEQAPEAQGCRSRRTSTDSIFSKFLCQTATRKKVFVDASLLFLTAAFQHPGTRIKNRPSNIVRTVI